MLHSGLVSVTFRKLSPLEIVNLVKQAGLEGIEWGGDVHVPPGDIDHARRIRRMTEDAGLKISSYGSYFRLGQVAEDGFETIAETASALGAPIIRVWAGHLGSAESSESQRHLLANELRSIASHAQQANIRIGLEFHQGTVTDTAESALKFLKEVDHSNVSQYWQPPHGAETADCLVGLRSLAPYLGNVHVFHWWPTENDRQELTQGEQRWSEFLGECGSVAGDRYALLEFVKRDAPEQFLKDAVVLKKILSKMKH